MDNLILEPVKKNYHTSPKVLFDLEGKRCEIEGESLMEETISFYKPLYDWLTNYFDECNELTFDFKLTYFNTSSSRCVLGLLHILRQEIDKGNSVYINWHYEEGDENMLEEVEDFMLDTELVINLVPLAN